MANPLINGRSGAVQNVPPNPMQFMTQFMQNPVGALRQAGFAIPDGMNNPQAIVNHLISNGQLGKSRLSQIQNIARLIKR